MNNKDYEELKGNVFYYISDENNVIANIFSQEQNFNTDYESLEKAFLNIRKEAKNNKLSICIPYGIGCGIANGDWNIVYKIIEKVFSDCKVTLYKLEG